MNTRVFTLATPDGPFSLLDRDGVVLASGWTADPQELLVLISPRLRPASLAEAGGGSAAVEAVAAYYDGDLAAPSRVPVMQQSGPFRQGAWDTLRRVAPGRPVTYAGFAALTDSPRAVRAAAGACASNAAALFVPCHRVVRTDGSLGGFRWGSSIKESLLRREAAPSSVLVSA